MINKYKTFVQEYESILTVKDNYKKETYTLEGYLTQGIAFIIILAIFLGIGFITKFNENFNYVAYSLNAAVFGSFLFIKLQFEEEFKKQLKVKHNSYIAISLDMVRLLIIQLTVTAILFFQVFSLVVGNFDIIMLLVITSTLTVFFLITYGYLDRNADVKGSGAATIFFIQFYYLIIFRIIAFNSFILTILINTAILFLILIIKEIWSNTNKPKTYVPPLKIVLIFILLLIFLGSTRDTYYKTEEERLDYHVGRQINVVDNGQKQLEIPKIKIYATSTRSIQIYLNSLSVSTSENDIDKNEIYYDIHVNEDSVIFGTYPLYYIETIEFKDSEYHRYTYLINDVTVTLFSHEHSISELTHNNVDLERVTYEYPYGEIWYTHDDLFYLDTSIGFLVYDNNFNYTGWIQGSEDYEFISTSDTLYLYDVFEDEELSNDVTYTIFRVTNDFELSKIIDLTSVRNFNSLPFIINDDFYFFENENFYKFDNITNSIIQVHKTAFNSDIVFRSINRLITKETEYVDEMKIATDSLLYHDGYFFINKSDEYSIVNATEYLQGDLSSKITLSYDPKYEEGYKNFRVTDTGYIITDTEKINSFDKTGNFVEDIDVWNTYRYGRSIITNDSLYILNTYKYTNYMAYYRDYDLLVTKISIEDLVDYVFKTTFRKSEISSANYVYSDSMQKEPDNGYFAHLSIIVLILVLPSTTAKRKKSIFFD